MSREPTEYERQLMKSLCIETLEELIDFMNLPPHPDLEQTMRSPDTSESTRWDEWLENESEKEKPKNR